MASRVRQPLTLAASKEVQNPLCCMAKEYDRPKADFNQSNFKVSSLKTNAYKPVREVLAQGLKERQLLQKIGKL